MNEKEDVVLKKKTIFRNKDENILCVEYFHKSTKTHKKEFFIACGVPNGIIFVKFRSGEIVSRFRNFRGFNISTIKFSESNKKLVSIFKGKIFTISTDHKETIELDICNEECLTSPQNLTLSDNGRLIIFIGSKCRDIFIVNLEKKKIVKSLKLHFDCTNLLFHDPYGLFFFGGEKKIKIRTFVKKMSYLGSGIIPGFTKVLSTIRTDSYSTSLCFFEKKKFLVVGNIFGEIQIYELTENYSRYENTRTINLPHSSISTISQYDGYIIAGTNSQNKFLKNLHFLDILREDDDYCSLDSFGVTSICWIGSQFITSTGKNGCIDLYITSLSSRKNEEEEEDGEEEEELEKTTSSSSYELMIETLQKKIKNLEKKTERQKTIQKDEKISFLQKLETIRVENKVSKLITERNHEKKIQQIRKILNEMRSKRESLTTLFLNRLNEQKKKHDLEICKKEEEIKGWKLKMGRMKIKCRRFEKQMGIFKEIKNHRKNKKEDIILEEII